MHTRLAFVSLAAVATLACDAGTTTPSGALSLRKAPTNSGDGQVDTVLATLAPFRVVVERGTTPVRGCGVRM
ncbi:MAG TPA: hypothetical protein VMM18_12780 [Gemmatimonadaceae bacterium]|nr:hypothetical protein [Gemmatimonadaceae bacterium]